MSDPTGYSTFDHAEAASPEASTGRWLVPVAARVERLRDRLGELNADLMRDRRPSRGRRVLWALTRVAATFGIGVAATLVWQPYGDAARMMIANTSPQLGWLAPQASGIPDSADVSRKATLSNLDAVREQVDRIAASQEQITRTVARLTESQQRIADEIAKVQEVEEYLLTKGAPNKVAETIPLPAPRPAALGPGRKTVARRPSASTLAER